MSRELDRLLQASLDADTPEWLDRLVVERVVQLVENETAAPLASSRRVWSDGIQRAASMLRRSGQRVHTVVAELLPAPEAQAEPTGELPPGPRRLPRPS